MTVLLAGQAMLGMGPGLSEASAAQLVGLSLNERVGQLTANSGTLGGQFQLTTPVPAWTTNSPIGVGSAVDFGTTIGDYGIDSASVLAGVGNLTRFTITGWLNCRSTTTGAGGNRIVRNYVSGGHGIDLVYRNDGSLDLGINAFAGSFARSSASRITTSATAAPGNWRFFAVTYDSTLASANVRYYFGSAATAAALDVTRTYAAGAVGANVGVLSVGAANPPARATATDRMFRGMIDDVTIHDTVLSAADIVALQQRRATVSIAAFDPTATEPGTDTGTFRLTRSGDTATALTVSLTYGGTATSGVDYQALPATVVIPATSNSVDVVLTPLDDTIYDPETVTATVAASAGYGVGTPSSATINLLDNEPPPFFDAMEIFTPVALTLAVPPVNYTGATVNDTRPAPAGLPVGTIMSVVLPGATVQSVTAAGGGFEFVVSNGAESFTVYSHAASTLDAGITVGSVVRVVATRTLAPGPLVADVVRLRNVTPGGLDLSYLYQGVVTRTSPVVWTVGGIDFAIITAGALPTTFGLTTPLVVGSTLVTVQFIPNATFPGVGGVIPFIFDAAEIYPPVPNALDVFPPDFRNPRADLTSVPAYLLPLSAVCTITFPGATVTAVNTDLVTGGREYVLSVNGQTYYAYTFVGTLEDPGLAAGSIVRVVARRTQRPGPIVIDVIRARPTVSAVADYAFTYQGIVTRADVTSWTIGTLDVNIVPLSGALPTVNTLGPVVLGSTLAEVQFVLTPGAVVPAAPILSITASDAAADEFGPDLGVFTITRSTPTNQPLVVKYTVTGTASNGVDYVALTGTATIPAAAFSVDVTVIPIDDLLREPTETIIATLQPDVVYYNVGAPSSATVNLVDDDTPSTISIAATDAVAGESGPDLGVFTFTRSVPTHLPLTVNYLIGGTAGNGTDYNLLGTSVTFAAGSATATVTVTPINDLAIEPTETVILTLLSNAAYVLGTPTNATVTIADDDAPSVVTVMAVDAAAAEAGLNPGLFTLTRTLPTNLPLVVNYLVTGTAANGVDYATVAASATIPAAAFTVDVAVTPIDDFLTEGTETVVLTLQANAAYTLGGSNTATVSIADDDVPATVTLTSPDTAAAEAALDPGLLVITRTVPTNLNLVVNLRITGTASNGVDYVTVPASVTIPAGSFSVQQLVTPIDDLLAEATETVIVSLATNPGYVLGAATNATISIADNDAPPFPQPLVQLHLNENTGTTTLNSGTLGGLFTRTTPTPLWTTNRPPTVGGASAVDFGTTIGNFGVDSPGVLAGLGNLPRFTLTGWLNNRSTTQGAGGNRVIRNFVSGGHGIDLVYRNDGSLDLGVNNFPSSVARSSASRIPASAGATVGNWRFFAVTYDSTLAGNQVRFYFGSAATDAVLDVTRTYAAGAVGPNVGGLTIGHVNASARAGSLDRMFRGLVDEVRIFGSVLTPTEIVSLQRGTAPLPRLLQGGQSVNGLTLSVDGGVARLAWPTESGQSYRIEFLDALGGGEWQVLSPGYPGDGGPATLEDAAKDQPQRFYRVFRLGTP